MLDISRYGRAKVAENRRTPYFWPAHVPRGVDRAVVHEFSRTGVPELEFFVVLEDAAIFNAKHDVVGFDIWAATVLVSVAVKYTTWCRSSLTGMYDTTFAV